jgi:hypothetical protein
MKIFVGQGEARLRSTVPPMPTNETISGRQWGRT